MCERKIMSQELVPIKVKIGLRSNGHADHPDWTRLPMINSDSDVRQYCPSGWIYDKSCGHQEASVDSPMGMQWGCLLGTRKFVDEALATFPELITELTEAEFQDFYNNKARKHLSENSYDVDVLKGLETELNLREKLAQDTTDLKVKIAKALDPNNDERGIKKNKERYWADYKVLKDISVEK